MVAQAPTNQSTKQPREGWFASLKAAVQTFLFGYDFFISYRSADASAYARSQHDGLRNEGFDCFLDDQYYEAGHNLPNMQSRALRRSTKLLVVVSPRAHLSPPMGTDWLLAEVLEFKHIAKRRASTAIVPIGTPETLSKEEFPDSRLLSEIPSLSTEDICILDDAAQRDGEAAPWTLEKLKIDFRQTRRRSLRKWSFALSGLGAACAIAFAIYAHVEGVATERAAKLADAFRYLDRGREVLEEDRDTNMLPDEFGKAATMFAELGRDPLMALHHQFAGRLKHMPIASIAKVDREVSYIKFSADGNWLLVVQDYQAPNGDPDRERILDWNAFGVYHIPERKWTLKQPLKTAIGKEVYEGAQVVAFEPPSYVIIRNGSGGAESFSRVSLVDGSRIAVQRPTEEKPTPPAFHRTAEAKARIEVLLSSKHLFKIDPADGIDMEYGPRLVARTYVEAPDGRTAAVGTYEGRFALVDLVTGLTRAETKTSPIYTAVYRPDGAKAYFCDRENLWEVDATGWPGVTEFGAALRKASGGRTVQESMLAVALAPDASVVAAVTTERVLGYIVKDAVWKEWELPGHIREVAALRVDPRRSRIDFVVADDGTVASASYGAAHSRHTVVDAIARPDGPAPTVAWLDSEAPSAWLATSRVSDVGGHRNEIGGKAKVTDRALAIHAVALPGESGSAIELELDPLRADGNDGSPAIHAIAKLGRSLVVFHGDKNNFESSSILDEQMRRVPLDREAKPVDRAVFPTETLRGGPDTLSATTQISTVLPGSRPDRLFVRSSYGQTFAISTKGQPQEFPDALLVAEHNDDDQSYMLAVRARDNNAWIDLQHGGTRSTLRYQVPWRYDDPPAFAQIAPDGRRILLAGKAGGFLFLDILAAK